MNKTTIIHHSADYDGIFCREIARKFLPDADLIGWDYGQPLIPIPAEGLIYILDLSPECIAGFKELPEKVWERVVWIDHHKSAIEKWSPKIPGYRIDGVAACRLAWQWFAFNDKYDEACQTGVYPIRDRKLPDKDNYFARQVVEPIAVQLAGEYDIWDKRDPNAELFQHGLRSRELTESIWEILLQNPTPETPDGKRGLDALMVEALLEAGQALQYSRTKENASIIKSAGFTATFEGLTFLVCNHARYNSQLFTAGLTPEHDACMGFTWKGGQWTVSLYHAPGKEHHDLSLIAVKRGGGGHRGACGFRCAELPFKLA